MYVILPFKAEYAEGFDPQNAQNAGHIAAGLTRETWEAVEKTNHSFAGFRDDRLLGMAGVALEWPGRATAWMLVHGDTRGGADLLWMFRQITKFLDDLQVGPEYRRVETTVLAGFKAGHRLAKMLGFQREGYMRCYDSAGQDHVLYARLRHG